MRQLHPLTRARYGVLRTGFRLEGRRRGLLYTLDIGVGGDNTEPTGPLENATGVYRPEHGKRNKPINFVLPLYLLEVGEKHEESTSCTAWACSLKKHSTFDAFDPKTHIGTLVSRGLETDPAGRVVDIVFVRGV